MTDPPRDADAQPDRGKDTAGGAHPGLPRWVKVSGIIVAVLVLVLVVVMLFSGGNHGPSRHASGGLPIEQVEQRASTALRPDGDASSDRGDG
jgi:hypothetical protein